MLCPVVKRERGVGGSTSRRWGECFSLLNKRLSKHQTTGKWLVRNHAKFEFMAKQVPECTISGRKKRQKRGSAWITKFSENQPNCCSWKAANFPHDNRKTNCSLVAALEAGIWKTAGHFTNKELQHEDSELVIWNIIWRTGRRLRSLHSKHLTGYLDHIWTSF